MVFYWTETMESTHTYLLDYIKKYDFEQDNNKIHFV